MSFTLGASSKGTKVAMCEGSCSPCPLVQPFPRAVPTPTKSPATIYLAIPPDKGAVSKAAGYRPQRAKPPVRSPDRKSRRQGARSPPTRPLTAPEIPRTLPDTTSFPSASTPKESPPRSGGRYGASCVGIRAERVMQRLWLVRGAWEGQARLIFPDRNKSVPGADFR